MLYDGVRSAAERVRPDVVLLHLGVARFAVTGPLHYTLTPGDAVTLCDLARPWPVVPVHYEGCEHFSRDGPTWSARFAGTRRDVRWLPIGEPVELRPQSLRTIGRRLAATMSCGLPHAVGRHPPFRANTRLVTVAAMTPLAFPSGRAKQLSLVVVVAALSSWL